MIQFHATTICAVRRPDGDIAIGGDGQVTMGETTIMKNGAKKVKKIYKDKVLTGFAGSVADAFSRTSSESTQAISRELLWIWHSTGDQTRR